MLSTQATNHTSLPFVSVIVPVFNEEKNIGTCIESLLNQNYPRERYEIIIVDNNSKDRTREIISRYPVTLLVEDKIRSSYAARNKGIDYAKGEILAFTDGDTRVSPDWLKNGVSAMLEANLSYLGCRVEMYSDSAKFTYCDIYELLISFDVQRWLDTLHFAPTCALLVRKSVFDAIGKFDSRLFSGGDIEFGNRVWRNGFKQGFSSSAVVYHLTRSSFKDLMKRALRYGGGQAQLSQLYPQYFGKPWVRILNPRSYLPPKPWDFARRIKGKFPLSLHQKIIIYFLDYLNWLVTKLGVILYQLKTDFKLK